MANSSRDKLLYQVYVAKMKSILKDQGETALLEGLSRGKNSYLRLDRVESSSFDASWIDKIEGVLYDLGEIIKVPRSSTISISDLEPIELAKKINGESVQHLASHTQYIKEVDDYGNVVPSKILSFSNEDNILTYENRFIATFIRKLVLFIEKRYEFVLNFATLHDEEVLYLKNHSYIGPSEIEIETKVKVKSISGTDIANLNTDYFHRIAEMRKYILYYYNSPFMKAFKTEKNVRNPILQTNIIRKNLKYHHCYEVYRYIESYSTLGVSYRMDEQYSEFTPDELKELNYSLLASYLSLQGKDKSKVTKGQVKEYKPRILTSSDDESFIYGPYLRGPVSFVRVDEGYQQYLERLMPKDLPKYPTKKERAYYEQEYQDKKDFAEFLKQRDALLRRKEKEVRHFDKEVEKILAKREEARLALAKQEQDVVLAEETDLLNKIRAEIVASAHSSWDQLMEEEAVASEEQREEEIVPQQEDNAEILAKLKEVHKKAKKKASDESFDAKPRRGKKKEEPAQEEENSFYSNTAYVEPLPEEEIEPVEEQPIEEPNTEEAPVETPVEEAVEEPAKDEVEPQPEEQSAPEEEGPIEEAPIEEAIPEEEKPVEEEVLPEDSENDGKTPLNEEEEEEVREPIPGTFLVKTLDGYVTEDGGVSPKKNEGKIFDDFNEANQVKQARGGKVVKV